MICDLPNKIGTAIGFNLTLYFMTNLRRTPGHFFVFLLFSFTCTLTMSMYFRFIAASSRTFPQVSTAYALNSHYADGTGYGTGLNFQSGTRYLYRIYYPGEKHASLATVA